MDKVQKHLNDIERKVGKCNKIAEKGEKISLADAIKLGRKSNSIVSTIKKCIKDYDVSHYLPEKKTEGVDVILGSESHQRREQEDPHPDGWHC